MRPYTPTIQSCPIRDGFTCLVWRPPFPLVDLDPNPLRLLPLVFDAEDLAEVAQVGHRTAQTVEVVLDHSAAAKRTADKKHNGKDA